MLDTALLYSNPWRLDPRDFLLQETLREKLKFLLRYAVLAPSTRNTQPWKFGVSDTEVRLFADMHQWQKIADPEQRELHISLGCALENLLIAAEHFGYTHKVHYFPSPLNVHLVATVALTPNGERTLHRPEELFYAIPGRHTSHHVFEPRSLPMETQQRLMSHCVEADLHLHLASEIETRRQVDALVTRADAAQFADPAFREEVGHSIGEGNLGTPWLLSVLGQLAVSCLNLGTVRARKDHSLVMSAPTIGILSAADNSHTTHVRTGQVFQRLWLAATARGLSLHPLSQLVEVPGVRQELQQLLPDTSLIPQQPFRLGYAEARPHHSPRRSLEEALL